MRVVQTPASRRFVGAASFAALTGAPVLASEFERDPARGAFPGQPLPAHEPLSHLALVANADVYLIAPASANTIAKLADGLADNLLTSCALAATCPLVLAPAMNNHMYEHPATQANLSTLRERGVDRRRARTSGGWPRRGEEGVGRLAEPARLLAACATALDGATALAGEAAAPTATAWRACACSSPPAARASRSTACASSATAPPGAWASRSRRPRARAAPRSTLVAANVALPAPRRRLAAARSSPPRELRAGLRAGVPAAATCC